MLKFFRALFLVLTVGCPALMGLGCDDSTSSSGTGGAIGTVGTGGAGGSAGEGMGGEMAGGAGGDMGGAGGGVGGSTGTGGSGVATMETNLAILNAAPADGVMSLDPSIGGTPLTYSSQTGVCQ